MVAENGQMAIHLPISEGRIGPFSTRTAHPEVLRLMEAFLNSVMGTCIQIQNPYVNRTKAEVIAPIFANLPEAIPVSSSCWKNARLPAGKTHCGFCIPCIIRRIAVEVQGVDATQYLRNLFADDLANLGEEDDGRRNIVDYAEFMQRMLAIDVSESTFEWPELISDSINVSDTVEMYRRAAIEATQVLGKYSGLAPLLT